MLSSQEISQLLMVGVGADADLSHLREVAPGGVILFARNAGKPAEVRRLTRAIEAAVREGGATSAPLIATDQEGGRVQRFTDGFTAIPSMRDLAAQGAQKVGITAMNTAAELRAAGVYCNFAPVCDVPTHPEDTVIGNRAFSTDPIVASLMAAEYIRAAQPNVLCVAKHFPGHGNVGVDSHHALPVDRSTREQLEASLVPFRAAIGAGVGGVMIGHMALPNIEPDGTPASLSRKVVTDLLRDELNFRGVIFTDDLAMKALPQENPGDVAVRALQAGNDMLLFCHEPDAARQAHAAITEALNNGTLDEAELRASIERIHYAKRRLGLIND